MAKQVIILERVDGSPQVYKVLFWLAVPVGRQPYFARPGATSTWVGASQAENDAIAAGQIHEQSDTVSVPDGATPGEVASELEARWASRQQRFNDSLVLFRYGSYWDPNNTPQWTVVTA